MFRTQMIFFVLLLLLSEKSNAQNEGQIEQLNSLMESCQFSQAIILADTYLQQDSTRTDLLLLKGRALTAVFRYGEAISVLRKAQELDSTNIMVLNELVNVYRSVDADKAVEISRKIHRLEPGNRFFSLQLANLYYFIKEYHEALQVLLPMYVNDTTDFYVTKQLAVCYEELKKADLAMFYYKNALKISPFDPNVTVRLVNLLITLDEVNTAYYLTTLFLKQNPTYILILKQSAYCNYLIHDFQASAMEFRKCIQLGDSSKFTRKYLGLSYYKQDKYDSAAPWFRSAFFSDTTDAEVCFYYAVSCCRSNSVDTGLIYLQRTMKLIMPSNQFLSTIYNEMATAYTITGHADTALIILKKALITNPDDNIIRFKIAYQYDYHLREPYNALPWYEKFLKNIPPQPQHDPLDRFYNKEVVQNGIHEITVSYQDYAKNRIRLIPGPRKKNNKQKTEVAK